MDLLILKDYKGEPFGVTAVSKGIHEYVREHASEYDRLFAVTPEELVEYIKAYPELQKQGFEIVNSVLEDIGFKRSGVVNG